jgi:hypothetical protein
MLDVLEEVFVVGDVGSEVGVRGKKHHGVVVLWDLRAVQS